MWDSNQYFVCAVDVCLFLWDPWLSMCCRWLCIPDFLCATCPFISVGSLTFSLLHVCLFLWDPWLPLCYIHAWLFLWDPWLSLYYMSVYFCGIHYFLCAACLFLSVESTITLCCLSVYFCGIHNFSLLHICLFLLDTWLSLCYTCLFIPLCWVTVMVNNNDGIYLANDKHDLPSFNTNS